MYEKFILCICLHYKTVFFFNIRNTHSTSSLWMAKEEEMLTGSSSHLDSTTNKHFLLVFISFQPVISSQHLQLINPPANRISI